MTTKGTIFKSPRVIQTHLTVQVRGVVLCKISDLCTFLLISESFLTVLNLPLDICLKWKILCTFIPWGPRFTSLPGVQSRGSWGACHAHPLGTQKWGAIRAPAAPRESRPHGHSLPFVFALLAALAASINTELLWKIWSSLLGAECLWKLGPLNLETKPKEHPSPHRQSQLIRDRGGAKAITPVMTLDSTDRIEQWALLPHSPPQLKIGNALGETWIHYWVIK